MYKVRSGAGEGSPEHGVMSEKHYAIVANVADADSCLRFGARVVVHSIPGNPASVMVRGLSRGGRAVTKWVKAHRLENIRVAWEHNPPPLRFDSKESAERVIAERFRAS